MNNKRKILRIHEDVITVPEAISQLYTEYQKKGFKMDKKIMFAFWYNLKDNSKFIVYWEEGIIYEEKIIIYL